MQSFIIHILADYLIVPVVLGGSIALLLVRQDRYNLWARAIMVGLIAVLFAKTMSQFYHGVRPFITLHMAPGAAYLPDPGFPSDHTLLVFTVTFVVWATTKNKVVSSLLLAGSILVALGRILALVHTPLDVAGGILCALLAACCIYGRHLFTARS